MTLCRITDSPPTVVHGKITCSAEFYVHNCRPSNSLHRFGRRCGNDIGRGLSLQLCREDVENDRAVAMAAAAAAALAAQQEKARREPKRRKKRRKATKTPPEEEEEDSTPSYTVPQWTLNQNYNWGKICPHQAE